MFRLLYHFDNPSAVANMTNAEVSLIAYTFVECFSKSFGDTKESKITKINDIGTEIIAIDMPTLIERALIEKSNPAV